VSEIYLHPKPERLEEFAAGQLDALEAEAIDAHLAGCQACSGEVAEWRELYASLSALPRLSPSAGFTDRVLAGLNARAAVGQTRPAWRRLPLPSGYRNIGLLAACLAIPILLGYAALVWWSLQTGITWDAVVAFGEIRLLDALAFAFRTAVSVLVWSEQSLGIVAGVRGVTERLSPSAIAALAFAAGTASSASAWVLYRNLIQTPSRKPYHARIHG